MRLFYQNLIYFLYLTGGFQPVSLIQADFFSRQNVNIIFCYMSEIFIENPQIEEKMLTEENFEIKEEYLKYIFCDGKQCNPTNCLRTSCLVFEYWRHK